MENDLSNEQLSELLDAFGKHLHSLHISLNEWLVLSNDVNPHEKHRALLYLLSRNSSGGALRRSRLVKERLLDLIYLENSKVRGAVLIAMGSVSVPEAVPKLISILRSSQYPRERYLSAYALGFQRDTRGLEVLLECAKNPAESIGLREQCIRSLGNYRSERVLDELSKIALSKQWELRWASAQSLRRLDTHLAVRLLTELCEDSEVPADLRKTGRRWIREMKRRTEWIVGENNT